MPLVTVESWEETTRTSKDGKEWDCVVFYGTKHGYEDAPDEPWEKAMAPWADGEWIKEIQSYKTPAKLLIRNEKEGKFWKVVSIEPWDGAEKTKSASTPDSQVPNIPEVPRVVVDTKTPSNECMGLAVTLVKSMLDNSTVFKSLVKKSVTPDTIVQLVGSMTEQLESLLKNKEEEPELTSNSEELKTESEEMEQTEIPF